MNDLCLQMSDWDRFAAEEYELLVAEEGNAEGMDDLCYEEGGGGNGSGSGSGSGIESPEHRADSQHR